MLVAVGTVHCEVTQCLSQDRFPIPIPSLSYPPFAIQHLREGKSEWENSSVTETGSFVLLNRAIFRLILTWKWGHKEEHGCTHSVPSRKGKGSNTLSNPRSMCSSGLSCTGTAGRELLSLWDVAQVIPLHILAGGSLWSRGCVLTMAILCRNFHWNFKNVLCNSLRQQWARVWLYDPSPLHHRVPGHLSIELPTATITNGVVEQSRTP